MNTTSVDVKHSDLKALRLRLGTTQAALARTVGVVPNTLARWERGELPIPAWAVQRLEAASSAGSSGRAVTRGVVLDPHHKAILDALNADLDPAVFEACATDLLRCRWPTLVAIRGGHDHGFDGTVADPTGHSKFPLIATTAKDLTGNLRRNLRRARELNPALDRALFATSRVVTPRMREKLQDQARDVEVTLVQIYDQDWFALELYRKPEWCKRLLRVTGRPSALSQFPKSQRPVLGDEILGRERVMRWLLERSGDCLLVGSPGSGKTFVLRGLVQQGRALFLVDDDRTQVANDLRELRPPAVILDDAHVDPDRVDWFRHLRQEVGSDARIIATTWPSRASKLRTALGISTDDVRNLDSPDDLIDADTMIEIIKSTGLTGPDELLRCIRLQAPERPGLVATLAYLCRAGDFRQVVSGEALVDQLAPQLEKMIDSDALLHMLAPFALGGDAGVRPERVAGALGKSLFDVSKALARLGPAGILKELPTAADTGIADDLEVSHQAAPVSVVPAPFRWVLVRRIFFGGVGSLPLDRFLALVERTEDALDTLMGARARGAPIPDLEHRLEREAARLPDHSSSRLWSKYASLGPSEARYVVERHPDRLPAVAHEALEQAPESVIPLLLDLLCTGEDARVVDSLPEKPWEILTRWANGSSPGRRDLRHRRSSLLHAANAWRARGGDPNVAIRAMCIALAPGSDYVTVDPGAGRTVTLHHELLIPSHIESLKEELWPSVREAITETGRAPWKNLMDIARGWLNPFLPSGEDVLEEIRLAMRSFGDRLLQDMADVSRIHPGVQHRLKVMAKRAGLDLHVTLDPTFETLYGELEPDEVDEMMRMDSTNSLVETWERQSVQEITRKLKQMESEANLAGIRHPRWSPYLCEQLAMRISNPVVVAELFLDSQLPADLVAPFIRQVVTMNGPRWPEVARRCLGTADYQVLGIQAVLISSSPPPDLLATALGVAKYFPHLIHTFCLRREVPLGTLKTMFHSEDARVAVAAAIGYWCGHRLEANDDCPPPPEGWREAVLRAPADEAGVSQHEEYWLSQVLLQDGRLAEEWLLSKFGEEDHNAASWSVEQIGIKILPALDTRQRSRVLAAMRPGFHGDEFVRHLVANDLELYRELLGIEHLAPFHLSPLAGKPDSTGWRAKVKLALAKGFAIEKITRATLGRWNSWSGNESEMWAGWRRSFAALIDDVDHDVASIGQYGVEITKRDEDRTLMGERYEAVHGM